MMDEPKNQGDAPDQSPPTAEEATAAAAPPPDEPKPPKRKIMIGSQRSKEGAPKPKAIANLAPSVDVAAKHTRMNIPPPNIRERLSPELEKELQEALGDASIDSLIEESDAPANSTELVPESRVQGTVLRIHRDDVFVELGGRNQGIVSLRQFEDDPPKPGAQLDLVVARLNPDDGLFELTRPGAAVDVANWDDVAEGTVVEVTITGANKGGLECKIAGIRGFIPMGQISLYRVENPEEFVDQRLACVVAEVDRDRRNLVLSHRAVMEREKAAAREKLLAELAAGQTREGTVRSLKDFGAFVDLGGVDGLIHISQMSWDRVNHPSEVLKEGQTVKVKIERIDSETGKIGLSYRDTTANPWDSVDQKYAPGATARGAVTKLMDFGAFVKLEPGVEGLIHISELAHGRVHRTADVLAEGQEVDVKILSVDREAQRIGLSLRALVAPPAGASGKEKNEAEEFELPKDAPKKPKECRSDLKGGVGTSTGGEKFGLKW